MTRGLMETLEARATWAANKRLELRIGPSEVDGLEVLRPEVSRWLGWVTFVLFLSCTPVTSY